MAQPTATIMSPEAAIEEERKPRSTTPRRKRGHNGADAPTFTTRGSYESWGLTTEIDEDVGEFVIRIPFAPDELPYYPVMMAALIAGRSPGSMYNSLSKSTYGLTGVKVEGITQVTHDSLVEFLARRDESADATIARKRRAVTKLVPKKPRRLPTPPEPVVASMSAEQLLESGALDFLDELR